MLSTAANKPADLRMQATVELITAYASAIEECRRLPLIRWASLLNFLRWNIWIIAFVTWPVVLIIDIFLFTAERFVHKSFLSIRYPFKIYHSYVRRPLFSVIKGEISAFSILPIRFIIKFLASRHAKQRLGLIFHNLYIYELNSSNKNRYETRKIVTLTDNIDKLSKLYKRATRQRFESRSAVSNIKDMAALLPLLAPLSFIYQPWLDKIKSLISLIASYFSDSSANIRGVFNSLSLLVPKAAPDFVLLGAMAIACFMWILASAFIEKHALFSRKNMYEIETKLIPVILEGTEASIPVETPLDGVGLIVVCAIYATLEVFQLAAVPIDGYVTIVYFVIASIVPIVVGAWCCYVRLRGPMALHSGEVQPLVSPAPT